VRKGAARGCSAHVHGRIDVVRSFVDRSGRRWDVVIGHESWGGLLALFVPAVSAETHASVRQSALRSVGYADAMHELESLDDAALQQLLDRSVVKEG
jgi:hypothetical protein